MRILHIVVNNKIATYTARDGHIVCGNSDYSLKFTFDSEWDNITQKTARFIWNGKYYDVEFTGDECAVPIINDTFEVTVGVYAGKLTTTTPAVIPCDRSILCITSEVQDDQLPIFKDKVELGALQAVTAAAEAKKAAEDAKAAAERAEQAATDAESVDSYTKIETEAKIDETISEAITNVLNTEV